MSALDAWNAGTALTAPVPTSLYPVLSCIFLVIGLVLAGSFVVQSKSTSLLKQVQTSLGASVFLGFGIIFTSISVGVYL
ncbi:hypothetical protein BX666DRAFT_1989008 [Dichotomocladium elegans]|nr:hypothetical protein BX666DRAFT_1989008 [Dichotomocladium elegans]